MDPSPLYEVTAHVTVDKKINLKDIYTDVRAIEGVTVVSTAVERQDIGASLEKAVIKIKFLKGNLSIEHYMALLAKTMMRTPGITSVSFTSAKKVMVR